MADHAPGQPMEEILASIKRIIHDEGAAPRPGATGSADAAPSAAAAPEDVLELSEPLGDAAARPLPASPPGGAGQAAPAAPAAGISAKPTLVSDAAEAASRKAFAALSSISIDPEAGADTLDGLVRELLRPMLRAWLDQNLPEIVERLVAREIARLGGR